MTTQMTTQKETTDHVLLWSLSAGAIVIAALGALTYFKGDVLLFAITNSAQVRAEKADWDSYIKSYGTHETAELPKE